MSRRRYVRITIQTRSGRPIDVPVAVAGRAGAGELLAWLCGTLAGALGLILLACA